MNFGGLVAQLEERPLCMREVSGSNPLGSTAARLNESKRECSLSLGLALPAKNCSPDLRGQTRRARLTTLRRKSAYAGASRDCDASSLLEN